MGRFVVSSLVIYIYCSIQSVKSGLSSVYTIHALRHNSSWALWSGVATESQKTEETVPTKLIFVIKLIIIIHRVIMYVILTSIYFNWTVWKQVLNLPFTKKVYLLSCSVFKVNRQLKSVEHLSTPKLFGTKLFLN